MPEETSPRSSSRRPLLLAGLGLLLVLAVIVAVVTLRGGGEDTPTAPTPTPTTAAPTPPPFPEAPASVSGHATLTVPEEPRFAEGTFWARAGQEYLVTVDVTSEKPEGSDGNAMYLGVTLSCSPQAGGPGITAGGTQNMLTGEETTYRNQGLVTVAEDGPVDCSIKLSAPYDDVASNGTTFDVDGTWRATAAGADARQASTDSLPRTVDPGPAQAVLSTEAPVEAGADLRALTSLHLTTCTIVNGSREDGRAWCDESDLDEAGSTVQLTATAQLLDPSGEVCQKLDTATTKPDHIDEYRHHRLIPVELEVAVPQKPCGTTVRVSVAVTNDGPAPLVVHRSNSSLVVVA